MDGTIIAVQGSAEGRPPHFVEFSQRTAPPVYPSNPFSPDPFQDFRRITYRLARPFGRGFLYRFEDESEQ